MYIHHGEDDSDAPHKQGNLVQRKGGEKEGGRKRLETWNVYNLLILLQLGLSGLILARTCSKYQKKMATGPFSGSEEPRKLELAQISVALTQIDHHSGPEPPSL